MGLIENHATHKIRCLRLYRHCSQPNCQLPFILLSWIFPDRLYPWFMDEFSPLLMVKSRSLQVNPMYPLVICYIAMENFHSTHVKPKYGFPMNLSHPPAFGTPNARSALKKTLQRSSVGRACSLQDPHVIRCSWIPTICKSYTITIYHGISIYIYNA